MAGLIYRTTMFKIPDPANQRKLLAAYELLAKGQAKDGKPYIVYVNAGVQAAEDPRARGYTVVAQTRFRSFDDMAYYDQECAAHAALKATAQGLGVTEPPLTTYFESGGPLVDAA